MKLKDTKYLDNVLKISKYNYYFNRILLWYGLKYVFEHTNVSIIQFINTDAFLSPMVSILPFESGMNCDFDCV